MTTNDAMKLKDALLRASAQWSEGVIDDLLPGNATARVLLKNGSKNVFAKIGQKLDGGIEAAFLMLADDRGCVNSDQIVDTLCALLDEMEVKDYSFGPFSAKVGKGAVCIAFPPSIFSDIIMGGLQGVKLTTEDFAKIKNLIN